MFYETYLEPCTGKRDRRSAGTRGPRKKQDSRPGAARKLRRVFEATIRPRILGKTREITKEAADMTEQVFTAARFAKALSSSKQNVHFQLRGTPPDHELAVNGNLAKAWKLESLPASLLRKLTAIAEKRGCRNLAELLVQSFDRYESKLPLAHIAPKALAKARKLQQSLADVLRIYEDRNLPRAEMAKRGLAGYERCFGHRISDRHWRTLFKRVISRDNGARDWSRLELYLEEAPPRISRRDAVAVARERSLDILEECLTSVAGLSTLNVRQKVYVWTKACDELQAGIEAKRNEKKMKRAIVKSLLSTGLLGADPKTIRRNLNRQWSKYLKNHGTLVDGRSARDQRRKLPDEDANVLKARILECGGRVSQAFREVRDNGELSAETLSRTIANPVAKSYVPARIRRAIGNRRQVGALLTLHRSARDFEMTSAHNVRDYSGLFAGDSYQADDCTCPVYYWEPDPSTTNGYRIVRGQLILLIDERTLLALGFALHSERNYNARIIRALITHVHDEWGLPRRRFYFERGLWQSAKILTGEKRPTGFDVPFHEMEMGLREFGIAFVHAKYPRGKVIERVLGLIQNEMERLPGYVGRDERVDRYDRVQQKIDRANTGQVHPSEFLMNRDGWLTKLTVLFDKYNSERRSGRILQGMSSLEAWNYLQPAEGQVHLGAKARVLLAEHRLKMRVQRNGIVLRPSLGGGTYCGEATGLFRGKDVLVWINPEDLSAIGITSLDRKEGPFSVARLEPLPTIDATSEQLATSAAQINAHNEATRTAYRLISPQLAIHNFRPVYSVDRRTSEIGQALQLQRAALKQEHRKQTRAIKNAQQRVKERGLNINVDTRNAERAAEAADLIGEAYCQNLP